MPPPAIDPTPGGNTANSYGSLDEANIYFSSRIPIDPPWGVDTDADTAALLQATRLLDAMSVARRMLRPTIPPGRFYYYTPRQWTGAIATDTQTLAWPRTGMFDRLGRAIPVDAIPNELKEAQFELAGQLRGSDRTLDNPATLLGLTSVKAGSVALTFKQSIEAKVLPDAVINLMPPSWFTDELIEYAINAIFEAD